MSTTYGDGKISVDIGDLFAALTGQAKIDFIDSLACEEEIITHVADIITTRWTEMSSSPGSSFPDQAVPTTAMDKAVREVAKRASQTAKDEIERLERALSLRETEIQELRAELLAAQELRRTSVTYGRY